MEVTEAATGQNVEKSSSSTSKTVDEVRWSNISLKSPMHNTQSLNQSDRFFEINLSGSIYIKMLF